MFIRAPGEVSGGGGRRGLFAASSGIGQPLPYLMTRYPMES